MPGMKKGKMMGYNKGGMMKSMTKKKKTGQGKGYNKGGMAKSMKNKGMGKYPGYPYSPK